MSLRIGYPRFWLSLGAAACALSIAGGASAQATERCTALNLPRPIYGSGGSAITATFRKVATALSLLPQPINIVYADPGACTGFASFIAGTHAGNFKYWKDGVEGQCLPELTGTPVTFAHMGNPAGDCAGTTLPADARDFGAPIQTLNVITAPGSSQQSISAEALYFAFGFGAAGQASPWINNAHLIRRNSTSFVHLFLASSIGVSPNSFKGDVEVTTNQASIDAIVAATAVSSESPLAYVSGSAADSAATAGTAKTLAFQAKDQTCAYWPDSGPTTKDKANVRSGQYSLWTPGHFFARVDGSGNIVDQNVRELIGWFDGSIPAPGGVDVVGLTIEAGDVPLCAMRATREGLTGAISSYAPVEPCSCYFEQKASGGAAPPGCTACTTDAQCGGATPKCRSNFCEAY